MRAGLSTWRCGYRGLVSVGAGLPTQRSDRGLIFRLLVVVQNVFFELCSFDWGHRFEEGLYPLYSRFSRLSVSCLGTVSGVVSFLPTHITCSSYVYSVSSTWCVSCLCGTQSTGYRVGHLWAHFHILAYPSQEHNSSSCHVVVRILFVHLVLCLPNVLCRSGFRKESQV